MKFRYIFLLTAILYVICGCTAGMDDQRQVASIAVPETDLESMEALFNSPQNNGLLLSVFDDASDIDLSQIFYNGADITNSVTEDERELYCQTLGIDSIPLDMTKITTAQANDFLVKWLGIGLSEINTSLTDYDGWVYLEDYDAYYFLHGDTNYQELDFISGEVSADQKQISVVYSLGEPAEYRTAAVKMNDDGGCVLILGHEQEAVFRPDWKYRRPTYTRSGAEPELQRVSPPAGSRFTACCIHCRCLASYDL